MGLQGPAAQLFRNILNFLFTSHLRTRYLFKDLNDQKMTSFSEFLPRATQITKKMPPIFSLRCILYTVIFMSLKLFFIKEYHAESKKRTVLLEFLLVKIILTQLMSNVMTFKFQKFQKLNILKISKILNSKKYIYCIYPNKIYLKNIDQFSLE